MDETVPKLSFGEVPAGEQHIKDSFDALETATRVHNKNSITSRDLIVAQTDTPLENWGRNQMILAEEVRENIMRHGKNLHSKSDEYIKVTQIAERAKQRLMNEFQLLHDYTRSHKGASFKALTKPIEAEPTKEEEMKNFFQKMSAPAPKQEEIQ